MVFVGARAGDAARPRGRRDLLQGFRDGPLAQELLPSPLPARVQHPVVAHVIHDGEGAYAADEPSVNGLSLPFPYLQPKSAVRERKVLEAPRHPHTRRISHSPTDLRVV